MSLFVIWNVSGAAWRGPGIRAADTNAFGLDATFPAVMLALALPTLTSRPTRIAAGTGAVIAVALTPVLPAGLPLLAALGGLGTRWTGWRGLLRRLSRPRGGGRPRDGGQRRAAAGAVPATRQTAGARPAGGADGAADATS